MNNTSSGTYNFLVCPTPFQSSAAVDWTLVLALALKFTRQVLYTEAKAKARRLCPRGASRTRTCPRGHITEDMVWVCSVIEASGQEMSVV